MRTLKNWKLECQENNVVVLNIDNIHKLYIYVLETTMFRVFIKNKGLASLDKTWSIAPINDVEWEGRDRESVEGFSLPSYELNQEDNKLIITSAALKLVVHQPLWLEWFYLDAQNEWQLLASDRKTSAYQLDNSGAGVAHYQSRNIKDQYYGLGEKTGDLQRNGKRYEMRNLDAMGYNAYSTDPLYKHIPFTITHRNDISFGLFYDNLSSCWFDLGNELDNYHEHYRRWEAEAGDIDYYLFLGPKIIDVTKAFVRLTGKTIFGPKWSLGYSGSTMHYTDAPDAQNQLLKFIELCKQFEIPCDSFQLSSGYTSIKNKRYVFNWNYDKVPDPKGLTKQFHDANLRLAANIKPCLLQDHPRYDEVANKQLFVKDSLNGQPEKSVFWDDEGSHLDFTNPDTIVWWKNEVSKQLLEMGIDSTWNDNNEYEIWDGYAKCHGFGSPIDIKQIRPVMPLLMMKASMEAQQEFAPDKRPFLISRSGCAGMQRYVQTWSGDNRTSWQTLKYNIKMGLGMSLSGLYNIGHDVGGFSGNKPDAELFLRWVQNGVMHPRFTIHSWNDDATVNEPWMYPEITAAVRQAIELRYKLMPYLYTLLWQAHDSDEPMLRPTFLDHEHDSQTFIENDDFMLGQDLLVASVVEKGQRRRPVWLPKNTVGWYDFYTGIWFSGGQEIFLDAPLEKLPLLVKAGTALPLGTSQLSTDSKLDTFREFKLFPNQAIGRSSGLLYEDDGESWGYKKNNALWIKWKMQTNHKEIHLYISTQGDYEPNWDTLKISLLANEVRHLVIHNDSKLNIEY